MYFKLALPRNTKELTKEEVLSECYVEPLREAHVHTIESNLSNVQLLLEWTIVLYMKNKMMDHEWL